MKFTDIFVQRPVLATVVSLLILLIGLRAAFDLTVREFPDTQDAVITVQTTYIGADADLIRGFITTPLEQEIAAAEGIDYLESTSVQGVSIIEANLELDYDPYRALTEISALVDQVRNDLPNDAEDPTIDLSVGQATAAMYMSFFSDRMTAAQITDYLEREVRPTLNTVSGVQEVPIWGEGTFAMRVWLKPERLAAFDLNPSDIREVLQANNFQAAIGSTRGNMVEVELTADTDLSTPEEFEQLVIDRIDGATIRMQDVAEVQLGSESYDTAVFDTGRPATFVGIRPGPEANVLDVTREVRAAFEEIEAQLPPGLEARIPYDASEYIQASIDEVIKSLALAVVKVMLVIYLFLGTLRSVFIPAVTVPLSLIGAAFIMLLLGYSINLLTLLAMVLAIGLVVDDAIIVVENVHRNIEEGMTPYDASIQGARELFTAIIAMTITLLAVFAPIGFVGGLTGTLFAEFAFTLAGAVIISGIVALTLSPMMCSKILKPHSEVDNRGRFEAFLDRQFDRLQRRYENALHGTLNYLPVMAVFGLGILVSCYFLYTTSEFELAPSEDTGLVMVQSQAAPNASLDHTTRFTRQISQLGEELPEISRVWQFNGVAFGGAPSPSVAITGLTHVPWGERDRSQDEIQALVEEETGKIAGLQSAVFTRPPLPGAATGLPVQFVIGTNEDTEQLYEATQLMLAEAQESGLFVFTTSDMNFDRPSYRLEIDREKASDLGLTMRDVGSNLGALLGGADVNQFNIQGRSYDVVPQVGRMDRLNPEQLETYHVRTGEGLMVPLSTVASFETVVQPRELNRFQQLNAATIQAQPRGDVALGEALAFLEDAAERVLPEGYSIDYAGQSRQFVEETGALVVTFFLALLVIYLVLAALFESFRDPLIILVSVPMSICGALIFVSLGVNDVSINIYTQVGLVTLIGVISKHGILIVQFANQLQARGHEKRAAIERASAIRLRPVLMTTAALVLAVAPLMLATGAGAESRFAMGLVVSTGLLIGTLFTLFMVPAVYQMLARDRTREAGAAAPAVENA